jgi:hypothetical protein
VDRAGRRRPRRPFDAASGNRHRRRFPSGVERVRSPRFGTFVPV